MTDIPVFETQRLILRGVTREDIPAYQRHFVDWEVIRFLNNRVPWPYPENGVEEYVTQFILPNQGKTIWNWAIFERENPTEMIGGISLFSSARSDGKENTRGFWLGRAFHGRGYMTEAVARVTNYAFQVLGFDRLIIRNAVGNDGSARIKEKQGFRLLRIEAGQNAVDSQFIEDQVWELTAEDWRRQRVSQIAPGGGLKVDLV